MRIKRHTLLILTIVTISMTSCVSLDLKVRDFSIETRFLMDENLSYTDLSNLYQENSPEDSEGFAEFNLHFEGFNYNPDDVEIFSLKYELKPLDKASHQSEGIYKITFNNLNEKNMKFYVRIFLKDDKLMWNFAIIDNTYFNYGYYSCTQNSDGSPSSIEVTIDDENSLIKLDIYTFTDELLIDGYTIFPIPGGSIEEFKKLLSEPTTINK